MNTNDTIKIQGLILKSSDIEMIKSLIKTNPSWHRTRLSKEICVLWNWKRLDGSLKDMACRTMLLKLEQRKYLKLPKLRRQSPPSGCKKKIHPILHSQSPIEVSIQNLYPIEIIEVRRSGYNEDLFDFFIFEYHYLSFRTTVGESMKYLVFDKHKRPLGCVLFGSAAWKTIDRDKYIGWNIETREKNLNYLTNNTRFLILPWVKVPHLASFILGSVLRRLNMDWFKRYGHQVYLVETFVERNRFAGTCYKAANWRKIGKTAGRSRQDRYNTMKVPVKDIYIYPLKNNFRSLLNDKTNINQLSK
jgi:hypothetical protein